MTQEMDVWLAVFAGINALSVVALVIISWWYAASTANILDHVRRQTSAIDRQATATEASVALLRQTVEEQRGLGQLVVDSAFESARSSIESWVKQNIQNLLYLDALPSPVVLVPENGRRAVEHARLASADAALELSRAMDDLRRCEEAFEAARALRGRPPSEKDRAEQRIRSLLLTAEKRLANARRMWQRGVDGERATQ
jgi:hypothetical protein